MTTNDTKPGQIPASKTTTVPTVAPSVPTTGQALADLWNGAGTSPFGGGSGGVDMGLLQAEAAKWAASQQQQTSTEPQILRRRIDEPYRYYIPSKGIIEESKGPHWKKDVRNGLSGYEGEYWEKVREPAFIDWATKRAIVFGFDLIDKDGNFDRMQGWKFWQTIGGAVASNPNLLKSSTPEEFADGEYERAGGDSLFSQYMAARAEALKQAEPPNPITTLTQTSTTQMNPKAAEAAVDQLARGLLGRMASASELARYRKAINNFLASNPTVTKQVMDRTDPDNVTMSTSTVKAGASEADAVNVLEMRMRRGSEGMAFNAGKMIEDAMLRMDRGL